MAVDLGTAYISLVPTTKDLDKGIKSALDGSVKHADRAGANMGAKLATGIVTNVGKAGATSGAAFEKTFAPRVASAGKNAIAGLANLMLGSAQGIGGEVGGKVSAGITTAINRGAGQAIDSLAAVGTKGGSAMSSKLQTAGLLAAGGVALVGTAAIAATQELYKIGKAWDDIADGITAKTGLIGEELDKVTKAVKDVALISSASSGDIASVTSQLVQTLKLSGTPLEALTKQISDYNEMNADAPLNVRSFAKAVKQYGIKSVDEMTKLLDKLNNVAQGTGIPINDLIATMANLGPSAKEFNMPLESVIQVIAAFEESGLNFENATSAFRIALGNIASKFPGQDPAQKLRDIITEIKNLIDAGKNSEAIDLTKNFFGGRGYQGIFDVIKNGKLDVDKLNAAISQTGPTIEQQKQATDDWAEKWENIKNKIEVGLTPAAEGLFDAINSGFDMSGNIMLTYFTTLSEKIFLARAYFQDLKDTILQIPLLGIVNNLFGGGGDAGGGMPVPSGDQAPRSRTSSPLPGGGGGRGYMDYGAASAWLDSRAASEFSIGNAASPTRSVGSNANLSPGTVSLKDKISTAFPMINDIGGWRPQDKYPDHPSGKAIDVMIPPELRGTPAGVALGNRIAQMALADPSTKYVLWNQSQMNPGGGTSPMKDRGSPTENHLDHVHILTYDQGGVLPPGVGMVANNTGKPELVLNPEQQQQLIDQGIDPNSLVNGNQPQVDAGQKPMDPQQAADLQSSNRTEGFIPVAASNTGVAGTSSLSALFDLGNQAVGSAIDMGAQVAGMAASAAAAGAGAPGGGAAANVGIQIGASIAKRGAKLGFDLLGIGTDALIAQLFPFGAPRWIGYDYTNFAPQMSVMTPAAVTTGEKAINASLQQAGGPRAAESGPGANQNIFGGPTGTPPGPQPPVTELATPPAAQPGGPVSPETMSGVQQPITQDNAAQPWWQNLTGTYDQGGMLPPGGIGINMTNRPEPVLTPQQWDAMTTNISSGGRDAPLVKIDAIYGMSPEDVATKIESKQRLAMMRYAGRP